VVDGPAAVDGASGSDPATPTRRGVGRRFDRPRRPRTPEPVAPRRTPRTVAELVAERERAAAEQGADRTDGEGGG
jgi:hypothetical protein